MYTKPSFSIREDLEKFICYFDLLLTHRKKPVHSFNHFPFTGVISQNALMLGPKQRHCGVA